MKLRKTETALVWPYNNMSSLNINLVTNISFTSNNWENVDYDSY
jgi:hypothetical protein